MKRFASFAFLFFSFTTFALSIKETVRFPQATRDFRMEGLLSTLDGGLPAVPVKTLTLALPNGQALEQVTIKEGNRHSVQDSVPRSVGMAPLSWLANPPSRLTRASAPQLRGNFYPPSRVQVSQQILHGVPVAVINLYPVQINLQKQTVEIVDAMELDVELKAGSSVRALFPHQLEDLKAVVNNDEALDSYSVNQSRPNYDYLIISQAPLMAYAGANDFTAFTDSLKSRGLVAKIVDVETINSQMPGAELTEKIRDYVRQEYSASGIKYLLLAGKGVAKGSFLPSRKLWSKIKAYFGAGWVDVEENIPADSYYGTLDGSYNSNGNTKWGEPTDGDNGGDVDFLPEVTVGRVVLNTTADLQNFVRKSIWATQSKVSRNTLLMGEELFPEKDLYGDEYMDQLIGTSSDHGFTTTGFSPSWNVTKLYDRTKKWSGSQGVNALNTGDFSLVNHLGHSNSSYNMRTGSSTIAKLTNPNPFFYYTQGCLAGRYIEGSFVDTMVRSEKAAFAAVGNSAYGLAPEDPTPSTTKTPGTSHMMHRQFIDAALNKNVSLGKAHSLSKEAFIGLKSAQEIRWVTWTAHYFGDPSLALNLR